MNNSISTLKKAFFLKFFALFLIGVSFSLLLPHSLIAATMDDYCIIPPFVLEGGMKANLLLTLDNSGSMYDLQYIDNGKQDGTGAFTREPTYCYDQTYIDANVYAGYFERDEIYQYNLIDERFEPGASFPLVCSNALDNTLCVNIVPGVPPASATVDKFIAKGNYLNWLTASKFDVEKQILTGGKYDTATDQLIAETRGCVGRGFIKEANTADFVNYDSPETTNPNTSLNVTFRIKGPVVDNPISISPGGQTYIDIFEGNYNQGTCQEAITLLQDPNAQKQPIIEAIDDCLNNVATNKKVCEFNQAITCNQDEPDCVVTSGTCAIANNGVCGVFSDGTCSLSSAGTCTAYAGNKCTGAPNKTCDAGPRAGASCQNNAYCNPKLCTAPASKTGIECDVSSDCNEYACSTANSKFGLSCAGLSDTSTCDEKKCTDPASRVGDSCAVNTDCNSSACTSGPYTGNLCSSNWDCSSNWGHCLAPTTTQIKSTFTQSMHSCYQYIIKDQDVGSAEVQQVSNPSGCNQIYSQYKTCFLGDHSGETCTVDADCGTGTCKQGPDYILAGSPVLLCSSTYAGYCADSTDNWVTTTWNAREYSSADECILEQYKKFCGDIELPPVIDPTDDPSDTSTFANLPAILADVGIEAQLGSAIKTFTVQVDRTANPDPTGLIQEFSDRIRFGAMSFNFNGTATECAAPTAGEPNPPIPCPKVCSSNRSIACLVASDCPETIAVPNPTCDATVANTDNLDGAEIIHYIGTAGLCSINTGDTCSEDSDCPDFETGETCNTAGDHEKGKCETSGASCSYDYECIPSTKGECVRTLIHTIDSIRGDAWTPFSEGFLEAIGYYARMDDHTIPPTFGTSRTEDGGIPLRLNDTDYVTDKNPSQYKCQSNNILLISDGMSTADQNFSVEAIADTYNDGDGLTGSGIGGCPKYSGSRNLDDLAWLAQHREITDFTEPVTTATDQYKQIQTYTIYNGATSNDPDECNPDTLLRETADNGGGTYDRVEDPEDLKDAIENIFISLARGSSSGTAASVLASGEEEGANLFQAIFYPMRPFGTGDDAFTLNWSGTLQNLWFYIDPFVRASSIREDTDQNSILHLRNDYVARYYFDEADLLTTRVRLYWDQNGNYTPPPVLVDDIPVENLKNLWEAGKILWQRDLDTDPRTIYTPLIAGGTEVGSTGLMSFTTAHTSFLRPYLQAANDAESEAIIRYIHGEDTVCSVTTTTACSQDTDCPGGETCGGFNPIVDTNGDSVADFTGAYRKRTVGIDLSIPPDGDVADPGEKRVWKLGDIISSTPKVASWVPLETYDIKYRDTSYKKFICRDTRGTPDCVSGYDSRGTVFTGANDGMLHAFKLGLLQVKNDPANDPVWNEAAFEEARIINPDTGNLCSAADLKRCGSEIWAFIPKHVLPYLKYNAENGYCHLFNVDGIPYIFDASIGGAAGAERLADGTSWRTVLIGSMKYGGACREAGSPCTNCVKAPGVDLNGDGDMLDIVDGNDESRLGLSSYFAIDITDINPDNWELLWEFSDENIPVAERATGGLGFSTGAQSVVRINPSTCQDSGGDPKPAKECNGEWFVAIPSGPTGPINTDVKQFMGRSDQKLKVFIIDLRDGAYKTAIKDFGGEINYAFGGSALAATIDPDTDYQDDALYLGYTKSTDAAGAGNTFTEGGVVKVMTKEDPAPANWVGRKLIDGIGSVTAAVSRMENTKTDKLWIYFGSGRYYYKQLTVIDDAAITRAIYGVKDPCYLTSEPDKLPGESYDLTCTDTVSAGALENVTTIDPDDPPDEDDEGWFITLEAQNVPEAGFDAERVITDPVASTIGVTFFTTFKPSADICSHGGKSHLWAVKADTGGTATGLLKGKALMQVSTGSIEEIELKNAFKAGGSNPDSHGDRRSAAMTGKPPEGPGLIILTAPPPSEKVIHMREK